MYICLANNRGVAVSNTKQPFGIRITPNKRSSLMTSRTDGYMGYFWKTSNMACLLRVEALYLSNYMTELNPFCVP